MLPSNVTWSIHLLVLPSHSIFNHVLAVCANYKQHCVILFWLSCLLIDVLTAGMSAYKEGLTPLKFQTLAGNQDILGVTKQLPTRHLIKITLLAYFIHPHTDTFLSFLHLPSLFLFCTPDSLWVERNLSWQVHKHLIKLF